MAWPSGTTKLRCFVIKKKKKGQKRLEANGSYWHLSPFSLSILERKMHLKGLARLTRSEGSQAFHSQLIQEPEP